MRTWFITGAARGLGLAIARLALDRGDRVIATARQPAKLPLKAAPDRLCVLALDVTDPVAVESAVEQALRTFGRIDVLVNNAGYGQLGAFEEIRREDVARQFATNVFGVFDVTRAILPSMRRQRSGRIITISSIAGLEGFEGSSIYCGSKHAVTGWSEALAHEVAPFGIRVTCVCPGRFRTDFLDGSSVRHGDLAIADYEPTSARHRAALDAANHAQVGDPQKLAELVGRLVESTRPPVLLGAGSDAYALLRAKAESLQSNAEDWKEETLSTDLDE